MPSNAWPLAQPPMQALAAGCFVRSILADLFQILDAKYHQSLVMWCGRYGLTKTSPPKRASGGSLDKSPTFLALGLSLALVACDPPPAPEPAPKPTPTAAPPLSLVGADPAVATLIKSLLAAARDEPRSAKARGNLALALDVNGFKAVAIRTYGQAAALNPSAFSWPYLQALLLGQQGEYDAALAAMATARKINPGYVAALLWQGEWQLEQNQIDGALESYREAERLGGEGPAANAGIARALLRKGDVAAALEVLEPANRRWSYYQLQRLLGRAYRAEGRTEDAQIAFHRGNKLGELRWLDPVQGERERYFVSFGDRLARAERLLRSGRTDEVFTLLAELRDEQPDNAGLQRVIALANLQDGRTDTALDTLRRALAKHPGDYELHTLTAAAYRMSGRTARALEAVEGAIELIESRGEGHLLAATLHYQRLDREAALRALEAALIFGVKDTHNALQLAGQIEADRERWAAASERFAQAVSVDVSQTRTHLDLARALAEQGRFGEAEDALQFAAKLGTHAGDRRETERYVAALKAPQ